MSLQELKVLVMERVYLDEQPFIDQMDSQEKVIALGYFDGVHLGHQKVIQTAVSIAKEKGLEAAVMTFHPHPSVVLRPDYKREHELTPSLIKAELIEKLGVHTLFFVKFDLTLSQLSPQNFVDQYLIKLHAKHVVAGYDFTFGRKAAGNMNNIGEFSRSMFSYTMVPKVELFGAKVSTTHIRSLIEKGAVEEAAKLLGRPYETTGIVVHGDKRGRTLGFPTANVDENEAFVIPENGVYAVQLIVDGQPLDGVCSIGLRPTFYDKNEAKKTVEVYVLDFQGDLYGKKVGIYWHKRLRPELKFSSAEELVVQMEKDKTETREFFLLERNTNS
ncbi:bifunctional riboflavin kinase/FAD synthetase [Sporolactobacillus laevolacticus]|uniref:bifunctional riboflavin kinase/FAD synthetase n=1 Tax=Sporolactobacillus laevolacticus TaxID=33018 RepID=UPI0025B417D1|nr:bifunctional riboflavin kinase/FAD synthetase [Sporolactobacillus laevolacticus]MDN3953958.1 bifunctional riboflavin kinase/FAD synthetase [Sporolactobacillus laevolacticus]